VRETEREWRCREAADGIPEWPAGRSGIPSWVFLKHPLTRTSPRRGSRVV
jgi:hypothetical protein